MQIQPYRLDELRFAWCNRVFFRSRTHRRKPLADLAQLKTETLAELLQPYDIHLLELATDAIEFRALASLLPTESASAAASKIKGRISKWLGAQDPTATESKYLARGYFAVTVGQSTAAAIEEYLAKQSEHHGYEERARPPVYVQSFPHAEPARQALQTDHAVTWLRYHVVLATWYRRGVFGASSGQFVSDGWRNLQAEHGFLLDKVSFVPDHVHVALSLHPTKSPAEIVVVLMNAAQRGMWNDFEHVVVKAGTERLWQASAYVGSFGEMTSNAVTAYMDRWSRLKD